MKYTGQFTGSHSDTVSRRGFLELAGAALVIGVHLPELARGQSGAANVIKGKGLDGSFAPNAFVRIAADDTVTVLVKHIEFGQGPYTGLTTLVAEELDADWAQMRAEAAPSDAELYKNFAFGMQGTGGSTAIANSFEQMRKAGAAARAMLIAAAADEWNVPAGEISIEKGVLRHSSGQQSGFGALASKAATMPVPADPQLKDPKDFTLIGSDLPKVDTVPKTKGTAVYTLDVYRDDMLTAVVLHAPKFGATLRRVDDSAARKTTGVVDVRRIPQGVAVYGVNTYAALQGRDALKVEWDDSRAETRSSGELRQLYRDTVAKPGLVAAQLGDVDAAFADSDSIIEADYEFPFLAHAPMEPLDAVIEKGDDGVDAWLGSQLQTVDHQTIAGVLEVPPEKVRIHTMLAGGSFGRRAQPASEFAAEAAHVVRVHGKNRPIKLVWTREDDIRGGFYRPMVVHRLRGRIDATGRIDAWDETIATQSIAAGTPFEGMIQDGIDPTSVEGARGLPYAIPNLRVSLHDMDVKVPVLWWRSVGHTHTGFATETFIDELLVAAGKDPVEGRLALLGEHPRYAGVLRAVAEFADWGGPVPEGRRRGVAVHKSFDSYVAQVAEVSDTGSSVPRVHRIWCALDCGVAVNPNVIAAQMEGGIGYGLGAALFDEITLAKGGTVVQSNFHDYRSLRINEMPDVKVRIVASGEKPTGVGEPGVPPVAPAVANAWRALTGESVRRLPFLRGELS